MYKRVWTPTVCEKSDTESKITVYDFGAYLGELVDDVWTCWEVLSRVRAESGEIVEELRLMPQDWVPFDSYFSQTYTGHISGDTVFIRGWSIQTTNLPTPDPVLHTPSSKDLSRPQTPRAPQQRPQRPQRPQQRPQHPQQQRAPPQQRSQPQQRAPQPQQRSQAQQRAPPQQRAPQRSQQQHPQQQAPALRRNTQPVQNTTASLPPQWTPLIQVSQAI